MTGTAWVLPWVTQAAQYQAARCLYVAHTYLAAGGKAREVRPAQPLASSLTLARRPQRGSKAVRAELAS